MIDLVPAPSGDPQAHPRALIFDSVYDAYRGVVTYVRVVDGELRPRERIRMMSTGATHEALEMGDLRSPRHPRRDSSPARSAT